MISKYFILIFQLAPKFYYIFNEKTISICDLSVKGNGYF